MPNAASLSPPLAQGFGRCQHLSPPTPGPCAPSPGSYVSGVGDPGRRVVWATWLGI